MAGDRFLETYDGQTTEELLSLENECRLDSLVLAFEQGIQQKDPDAPLTPQERCVLAIEGLEREVNNGGYSQFFINSSHEFVDVIETALLAIRCPKVAAITRDALAALRITGPVTAEKAEAAALADNQEVNDALNACDSRYYDNDEDIADRLFTWIKENQALVRVGDARR